jgi:hypothetical protein
MTILRGKVTKIEKVLLKALGPESNATRSVKNTNMNKSKFALKSVMRDDRLYLPDDVSARRESVEKREKTKFTESGQRCLQKQVMTRVKDAPLIDDLDAPDDSYFDDKARWDNQYSPSSFI